MDAPERPGPSSPESNESVDARLPRRRCSAGVLLANASGQILVVKPTYRTEWLIPGGVVEAGESPAQAALRELQEETGLEATLSGLLCVDMLSSWNGFSESLHFLFAGQAEAAVLERAAADGGEILELKFVAIDEAMSLLPPQLARRLTTMQKGMVGYLEDGQFILPFLQARSAPVTSHEAMRQ